ncbi:MAG TPA: 3-dehydroquinate synthase [Candidatus Humimicrobiaceae bacterium]
MRIITAKTKARNYPIYINQEFTEHFPLLVRKNFKGSEKMVLVTNDKVFGIYEGKIKNALKKCSLPYEIIIIQDGEEHKNLEKADYIFSKLVDFNMHRTDIVIAFGGGVIGDLTGFVASTYQRGVKLIHCPTTIIGQVDSSIGGKVAINYRGIKNIVGNFYQPHMIFIDPTFNHTLEEKQIINGLSEVVKYGIVFKKKILDELLQNVKDKKDDRLFQLIKTKIFSDIIYHCCSIKSMVVRKDEFDLNYRNLLNFGHTAGHCIESAFKLKGISHGDAVSIGMIIAIDISISLGLCKKELKDRILELYKKLKLPYIVPEIDLNKIICVLKYDKKFKTTQNKFVLLKGLNKPFFLYNVDNGVVVDSIKKSMYNYI